MTNTAKACGSRHVLAEGVGITLQATQAYPTSPQHPLWVDRLGTVYYRLTCNVCGTYEDDALASEGLPAVDFECAACQDEWDG